MEGDAARKRRNPRHPVEQSRAGPLDSSFPIWRFPMCFSRFRKPRHSRRPHQSAGWIPTEPPMLITRALAPDKDRLWIGFAARAS